MIRHLENKKGDLKNRYNRQAEESECQDAFDYRFMDVTRLRIIYSPLYFFPPLFIFSNFPIATATMKGTIILYMMEFRDSGTITNGTNQFDTDKCMPASA